MAHLITLKNPHSILAALETRPQDVIKISMRSELRDVNRKGVAAVGDAWSRVLQRAREQKISIDSFSGRESKNFKTEGRDSGAEAQVKENGGVSVEELFAGAPKAPGSTGLWLALDGLQDPHNVGAIFRAAGFFGVQGILLTQDRSAPLTGTVYDVASGGLEYVPFSRVTNLQRAFELAKKSGLWILGTSEHAKESLFSVNCDRPWLLVLGNEENGLRRLTQETCDLICTIPCEGKVTSLNVSVAAGILISHFCGHSK